MSLRRFSVAAAAACVAGVALRAMLSAPSRPLAPPL